MNSPTSEYRAYHTRRIAGVLDGVVAEGIDPHAIRTTVFYGDMKWPSYSQWLVPGTAIDTDNTILN